MKLVRQLLLIGLALAWAGTAGATTIGLSQVSSDTDTSITEILANITFDSDGSTLTITVDNLTDIGAAGPAGYDISEIYFNVSADVLGLSNQSPAGWTLGTNNAADGFGSFDFSLTVGNNDPLAIGAGGQGVITLDITCDAGGDCLMPDFGVNDPTYAVALKFVNGPFRLDENDNLDFDSAWGASGEGFPPTVPEPSTVGLFALGLLGIGALGRRRR